MSIFRVRDEQGNTYDLPIVKGDPGYTPVKGEDYFTDADKAEFQEYIDEAMADHIADNNNPHQVTRELLELDNVDNTADVDKPVSALQEKAINDVKTSLRASIDSARHSINSHIDSKNNPHGVTPDQIQAAKSIHYHSANDIATGTLSVARGGTGRASHSNNAVLLGSRDGAFKNAHTLPGAFYATELNGAPRFGTLPIAQGGTGATTAKEAVENLGCLQKVKLWENEDTTKGFAEQTVSLDLAEYDGVEILFRSESSNANPVFFNTGHIPKGFRGCMHWLTTSGNRAHRMFTADDTGVTFEAGQYSANNTSALWCVPAIIYGIKGVM